MKNRTLRISLILAILTLVTSCFMGSTFAKYVTNNTGADTARVAKWGISVEVGGFKGFKTSYAKDDPTFIKADETVVATENVVAPGTTGTFGSFAVAGTPEVAVRVTYEASVVVSDWTVDGVYYCPLTVTVAGTPIYGLDHADATSFQNAIKDAIDACTADYAVNEPIVADNTLLPITWAWAYEGTDAKQTDEKDTALGNAGDARISITVKCIVTQIN